MRTLLSRPAFIALGLFCLALLPRVLAAGSGLTTDEAYHWVAYRSGAFLDAVTTGHFADTIITGHPGVTTMWLGSLGLLTERALQAVDFLSTAPPFPLHLTLLRLPMALATSLAVAGGYLLLRMVMPAVALIAALLWATDPFLIAHSRLLHLDALLTMLMLLATLALLAACFPAARARPARPHTPLLLLSGALTGLALLTKAPGVLLLPIGALVLAAWCWQSRRAGADNAGSSVVALLSSGLLWGGAALLTVFVVWPAMWVAPVAAVTSVVNEAIENGGAPHPGTFLLGTNYLTTEPGPWFYPVTLFARLTPWVVVGLAALPILARRRLPWLRAHSTVLLLVAGAALLTPLLLTIPAKKFDRYALPSVPLLHILAATGLYWLGAMLPTLPRRIAAGATLVAAVATLLWFHPYYLAYYNPLIGGSAAAPQLVPVGWGEGLDHAAAWLDTQPDLERGAVATWSPPTLAAYLHGAPTTWQGALASGQPGYLAIYVNQAQTRKESQYFGAIEAACTPVHTVTLHGIEYVRIYRVPTYTPRLEGAARFGTTLALDDAVLVPPAPCSCEPHTLTLVFEPLEEPAAPLFLFLHVVGEGGAQVLTIDLPLESLIPAQAWQSGEQVPYTLQLELPADTASGTYQILSGLYDPASGERLPIAPAAAGQQEPPAQVGPGTLRVGTFEVLADQRGPCE